MSLSRGEQTYPLADLGDVPEADSLKLRFFFFFLLYCFLLRIQVTFTLRSIAITWLWNFQYENILPVKLYNSHLKAMSYFPEKC